MDTKACKRSGCVRFGEGHVRKEHLYIGKKANQAPADKTVPLELGWVAEGIFQRTVLSAGGHTSVSFIIKMAASCCLSMRDAAACHTATTFV